MPKFRVQVTFNGYTDFEVEADDEDDALVAANESSWADEACYEHVDYDIEQIPEPPLVQLAREAKDDD